MLENCVILVDLALSESGFARNSASVVARILSSVGPKWYLAE